MYRNGNINFRRRAIDNDFHTDSLNKRQKSRQKGTTSNPDKHVAGEDSWKDREV